MNRSGSTGKISHILRASPEFLEISSTTNKYRPMCYENRPFVTPLIAIVDNSKEIRDLISLILQRYGYDVTFIAKSGEELLGALSQGKLTKDNLDVLLLDYDLGNGNMDGMETAIRIQQLVPTAIIVIMSGHDTMEKQFVAAGFWFIKKPFSIRDIVNVVSLLKEKGGGNKERDEDRKKQQLQQEIKSVTDRAAFSHRLQNV